MWPLAIVLGIAGVYLYTRYKDGGAPALHSPNIVVKDGVQYVGPETPAQKQGFSDLMNRVTRRGAPPPNPTLLTDGPLKGAAVLVYDVSAQPTTPSNEQAVAQLMVDELGALKTAVEISGSNSPLILVSVDQLDAVIAKTPPKVLTLFVAAPPLGLQAAKAPSAYAVFDQAPQMGPS